MDLPSIVRKYNQEHLLRFWDELSKSQKSSLTRDLESINWDQFEEWSNYCISTDSTEQSLDGKLEPAPFYPVNPDTSELKTLYAQAINRGKELIKVGKVAAFTVAGGQGTRLGFDHPKGMYKISPIKNKSLFQLFAESILRFGELYHTSIRWYIMTSDENEHETREYFREQNNFGLERDQINFLVQGQMPAFDLQGNLILKSKWQIAKAPDGHGGSLNALKISGALADMEQHGVDYISYFQVDNPLVTIIDPLFVGLHALTQSEMSSKSIAKTGPQEKMGVFCKSGDKVGIVEYTDLPEELAIKTGENGKLRFISGSPAIHIINRNFVDQLTKNKFQLPFHKALKKIPFINNTGVDKCPDQPNGIKLETFVFDALSLTNKTIILESVRNQEFAPVKNKSGVDSVESARKMMVAEHRRWLNEANLSVLNENMNLMDAKIEISPKRYVTVADYCNANITNEKIKVLVQNNRLYIS